MAFDILGNLLPANLLRVCDNISPGDFVCSIFNLNTNNGCIQDIRVVEEQGFELRGCDL
jgi:hypothetical protein